MMFARDGYVNAIFAGKAFRKDIPVVLCGSIRAWSRFII